MKTFLNFILVPFFSIGILAAAPLFKLTVLYDNYVHTEGTQADWGFACLVEREDETLLFDSGTRPEILKKNAESLGVDLRDVDKIIISHAHHDHTGGLDYVLPLVKGIPVYVPVSFPSDQTSKIVAAGASIVRVSADEATRVSPGIILTGEMGSNIKEQSLILESMDSLTIITGCSHQGIVDILKKAREISDKPIELVFGGFHLLRQSEAQVNEIIKSFQILGVRKCGPTHCTGDKTIEMFRNAYRENFVSIGVGKVLLVE